ncbi:MAG TPA: GNAT family N-acetyltransferase [Bacteroidia bacterium]|nr:GNAT family N-acetyltransferase [Bacteroidia bacterium]
MSRVIIREPNDAELIHIKSFLKEYGLDDSGISKEQFKILLYDNELAAFGRLKKHDDCIELSSVGVIKEYRSKKLGEAIIKSFLSEAKQDIYLVTVIPGFFSKMGFKEVKEYPASLKYKSENFCEKHHPGDVVTVMKHVRT